jgi:hypothetical protein
MDEFSDRESLFLPTYEANANSSMSQEKNPATVGQSSQSANTSMNEKMRLDLEAVTLAIDRLYVVAPQLHSQRVELKKAKLDELERARLSGSSSASSSKKKFASAIAKGKAKDIQELDSLMELLGKASSRRLVDQSVVLEDGMQPRIERAKQRDIANREAFVEKLVAHGSLRRLHSQDAEFQLDKADTRNPDAMLSLPEFIRERVPDNYLKHMEQQHRDPGALLSLPEFVKEPPPERIDEEIESDEDLAVRSRPSHSSKHSISSITTISSKSSKKSERSSHGSHVSSLFSKKNLRNGLRNRSLSAPPLAWLIPSLSRSNSTQMLRTASQNERDTDSVAPMSKGLVVRYVAEHQESLQHVVAFLGVDEGMIPGKNLEAEVVPSLGDSTKGDRIVLTCGHHSSAPLGLPVPVVVGKKEVKVRGGHYEIKLSTEHNLNEGAIDASAWLLNTSSDPPSLLDASHLTSLQPSSFICASCSLALVHPPAPSSTLIFRDLPSEYWAELLESWMCHADQQLNANVVKQGQGFCPDKGHALVGGSYILFEDTSVVTSNFREVGVSAVSIISFFSSLSALMGFGRQEGRHWVLSPMGVRWSLC